MALHPRRRALRDRERARHPRRRARPPERLKGTPFGAFLDSTVDRVGELFMLSAIGLVLMRDGSEWGVARIRRRRRLVPGQLHARPRGGDRPGRRRLRQPCRAVVISVGLALRHFGVAPYVVAVLTATAWLTVLQRILFVRKLADRP